MPKLFFLLAFFLIATPIVNAQNQETKILIEEYLKRSEQQRKTGLIMLGAGLGSVVVGTVLFGTGWSDGSDVAVGSGAILFTAGSISTLVSIPILISSASVARKGAKLSMGTSRISSIQPFGYSSQAYPVLSFSIPFNSQNP